MSLKFTLFLFSHLLRCANFGLRSLFRSVEGTVDGQHHDCWGSVIPKDWKVTQNISILLFTVVCLAPVFFVLCSLPWLDFATSFSRAEMVLQETVAYQFLLAPPFFFFFFPAKGQNKCSWIHSDSKSWVTWGKKERVRCAKEPGLESVRQVEEVVLMLCMAASTEVGSGHTSGVRWIEKRGVKNERIQFYPFLNVLNKIYFNKADTLVALSWNTARKSKLPK